MKTFIEEIGDAAMLEMLIAAKIQRRKHTCNV